MSGVSHFDVVFIQVQNHTTVSINHNLCSEKGAEVVSNWPYRSAKQQVLVQVLFVSRFGLVVRR